MTARARASCSRARRTGARERPRERPRWDRGAFYRSTPRLGEPQRLHLPLPFAHPGLDVLHAAGRVPPGLEDLAAALEPEEGRAPRLRALLSDRPPLPEEVAACAGPGARWRHAGLLVESGTAGRTRRR